MTSRLPDDVQECIDNAPDDMLVYTRDPSEFGDYDKARQVKNARFSRFPKIIAKCRTAEHVKYWFDCADAHAGFDDIDFVVRSGGHQHEARSTNDDSLVIDLSSIDKIEFDKDNDVVWIGSGAQLETVSKVLNAAGWLIPVGLCEHVNAGGLTHGGGWGLSWRTHGMTIDQLHDVEVVTGMGEHIKSARTTNEDLFKAIRGGGGGNFGVVTRLCFRLTETQETYGFSYKWDVDDRPAVAKTWTELMRTADHRLNSFCRFSVPDSDVDALVMVGLFYGTQAECEAEFAELFSKYPPKERHAVSGLDHHDLFRLFTGTANDGELLSDSGDPIAHEAFAVQTGPPGDGGPDPTCKGSHRHKVTSSFPYDKDAEVIIDEIDRHLREETKDRDNASLYVSLHGMGGLGGAEHADTSYPWRNKNFLIQGQAWWKGEDLDDYCMAFIDGLRSVMAPMTEGAFISFPDEQQSKKMYYGHNLEWLLGVKTKYDEANRLKYQLGLGWPEDEHT